MAVILTCIFTACDKGSQSQELAANEIYSSVDPSVVLSLSLPNLNTVAKVAFFIDTNGTIVINYHVI